MIVNYCIECEMELPCDCWRDSYRNYTDKEVDSARQRKDAEHWESAVVNLNVRNAQLQQKYEDMSQRWIGAQTRVEELEEELRKANQEGKYEWEKVMLVEAQKIHQELSLKYDAESEKVKSDYLLYMKNNERIHHAISNLFYEWSTNEATPGCHHMTSELYKEYGGSWGCKNFEEQLERRIGHLTHVLEKLKKRKGEEDSEE